MGEALFTSDVIYIAAADSCETDKQAAHYLCTGVNDQDVIQAAVDSVTVESCGEIRGRRIILLPGNYYISDFPRRNSNGRAAVLVPLSTNRFRHITIQISGAPHTESSAIHVTREAYENVAENESCSIFACGDYNQNHYVFQDFYVTVPDDQKKHRLLRRSIHGFHGTAPHPLHLHCTGTLSCTQENSAGGRLRGIHGNLRFQHHVGRKVGVLPQ